MSAETIEGRIGSEEIRNLQNLVPTAEERLINLDEIFIDSSANTREQNSDAYSEKEISSLAANIKGIGGLLYPLTVYTIEPSDQTENKQYILHVGFRRAYALRWLKENGSPELAERVRCLVLDGSYGAGALTAVQLMENMARAPLNPMEKSNGIAAIMNDPESNATQQDLAKFFGISSVEVSNLLNLQKLSKAIQDKVMAGDINFSCAREIARDIDEKDREHFAKIAETSTYSVFHAKVEEYKAAKSPKEGDAAGASGSASSDSSPRSTKMLSVVQIKDSYLPFLRTRIESADATTPKFTERDLELAREDAIKTVMMQANTKLATDITPFLQEQEAKANEVAKTKDQNDKRSAFFDDLVKRVNANFNANAKPDPLQPDKAYKLSDAMAAVTQEVVGMSKEQVAALGFSIELDGAKVLHELSTKYREWAAEAAKKKEAAQKRKAEKDAEKKKKAAEAAAGGTTTEAATAKS